MLTLISPELWNVGSDLVLWVFFFLGQCMWVLKCAAAAIRSNTSPVKTRREFVQQNWDIFALRMSLELPIFWVVRHVSISEIAGWLGWALPAWMPHSGGSSWLLFFCLGFVADIGLDTLAQSNKIPEAWRKKLKEEIPILPHPTIEIKTVVEGTKTATSVEVKAEPPKTGG